MGAWIWLRISSKMVLIVAFGRASVPLHSADAQAQASGGFALAALFCVVLVGAAKLTL